MAEEITETILDTTRRLEWEVSEEKFQNCKNGQGLDSGLYEVKIGGQSSKWSFHLKQYRKRITILIRFLDGDVNVEMGDIVGIKSGTDYWPCKPFKVRGKLLKNISISKIIHLKDSHMRASFTVPLDRKTLLQKFKNNKITVVTVLRFYVDLNENIEKNVLEKNFLSSLLSSSDLDTLADFTIACGDRQFKCHRVVLASRSTIFKAMLLNPQFVESKENSVTIEDASPEIVEAMLEFITKGVVPQNIEEKTIDLIGLADKYDLQDLIGICENSLVDNMTVENVIQTLIAIDLHVPQSQHRQKILDFVKAEAEQVEKSKDWKKFVVKYPDLLNEIFLSAPREPACVAGIK